MSNMYGCYFYNFDITHWFDTLEQAKEYGEKAGFQYSVIKKITENTTETVV